MLLAAVSVVVLAVSAPATAATLPSRFQDTVAIDGLNLPTVVRFSPDGRVFVAEKTGIVLEYDSLSDTTPTTVVDVRSDVNSQADRGLLGFTLDPNFPSSPYLYLLYTYDAAPGDPTVPRWNDVCPNPPAGGGDNEGCPVTGKLVRITLSGNVMSGSPTTLIEREWCQQFKSHSIGDLNFGPDGFLYASGGEGASFNAADWGQFGGSGPAVVANPCGDPPAGTGGTETSPTAEGGALRSQSLRRTDGPALLNGTIIRVDPSTGAGAPTNPLASSADPNAKRIVAYGLRNPFRFTFRPGTSDLWIGDVGWNTWEEIDVDNNVTGAANNYGWPCREGFDAVPQFSALNLCSSLTTGFTDPYFVYQHQQPVVPSESCPNTNSAISGISFYSGPTYPASYDGALFFADHSRNCIWAMLPGSNGLPDPNSVQVFETAAAHPVDLVAGPGGDLYYVDIDDGQIHRISFGPAVTLTAPTPGSATGVTTPTVSGAAGTAAGDLPGITVRIYSGNTATGSPVQTLTTTAGGAAWSTTIASVSEGQYTAQAEQDDNIGTHGFSATSTFVVDTTPPAVTLTAPATGSATGAATPTISGAAGTAARDLSTVTVRLYSGNTATGAPVQTLTTTAIGAGWAGTVNAPLGDGQYTAQAEQDDSAGNHGFSTPVVFTVDTTPPVNASRPAISGSPSAGQRLQCTTGTWSGRTPRTFAETWLRDGHAIAGATGARYVVAQADARHVLACRVTAHSVAGSTSATSNTLLARSAAGALRVDRTSVRGTVVTVSVNCRGISTQSCTGDLTLTVREKRRGRTIVALTAARSHTSTSTQTVILATHRIVLRGGARTTVRLTLSRFGKRLLSGRSRLPARLTAMQRTGRRQSVVNTQVLTFKAIGLRAR